MTIRNTNLNTCLLYLFNAYAVQFMLAFTREFNTETGLCLCTIFWYIKSVFTHPRVFNGYRQFLTSGKAAGA